MGRAQTFPQEFDRAQIGDEYIVSQAHDPTLFGIVPPEPSRYVTDGIFAEDIRRARNGFVLGAVAVGGLVADHTLLHNTPVSLTVLRELIDTFEAAVVLASSVSVVKSALNVIRHRRDLSTSSDLKKHNLNQPKHGEPDSSWL